MKKFWEHLGERERRYVAAGAGLLSLLLLVQFAVLPLWDERQRVNRAVEAQEKILQDMHAQLSDVQLIRRDIDAVQRAIAARPANFSLYSYTEKKAREAGVRSNVKSIQPARGMSAGTFEETTADLQLEKITLRQLVQFLYQADSPAEAVRIRKLSVRKSMENPEYLTATVQLITFQPAGGARPAAPGKGT